MEATGATKQTRAARLQSTTMPRKYMKNIPTAVKSCVTVHRAPRIEGSLEIIIIIPNNHNNK